MEERFADTLNELLVDTYRNVNKVEEAMLRSTSGLDLTISELHLIETVAQDGARGRTISQIAQRQELTLPSVTVAVNKGNTTAEAIRESGFFAAAVLTQDVPMDTISLFGFRSSREVDKFAQVSYGVDENGAPYLNEGVNARFACQVLECWDVGTHLLFLAEVTDCEVLSSAPSMTYAYYHTVKKGLTPPKASSYQKAQPKASGWRCAVCDYIYEGEELPADFVCPVCKQPASVFEKI